MHRSATIKMVGKMLAIAHLLSVNTSLQTKNLDQSLVCHEEDSVLKYMQSRESVHTRSDGSRRTQWGHS